MAVKALKQPYKPTILEQPTVTRENAISAVDRASRRLAPLWSLRNFVAVNPYLGFTGKTFEETAQIFARRAGAHMTAPRSFYAQAIRDGRITDTDLEHAISDNLSLEGASHNTEALKAFALHNEPDCTYETLPTIAHLANKATNDNWSDFVTESISKWAGGYFDKGQSYWHSPFKDLAPFAAWRAEAEIDRSSEVRGIKGFRKIIAQLPQSAEETIVLGIEKLGIPAEGLERYLHRLMLTIHGWASYGRYQLWEAELRNANDNTLTDLLAIRMAWEIALFEAFSTGVVKDAWATQKRQFVSDKLQEQEQHILANELLLQYAFEKAYQRNLISTLAQPKQKAVSNRKQVQAAFCIDVRSEVFRRAFESTSDGVETIGFAGFFGFPIEYVHLGDTEGGAQCPALITPQFTIRETVDGASDAEIDSIIQQRTMQQHITKAWRSFKMGAVSCFGFVGPVGLAYLKNLITDTFGVGRPVPKSSTFGFDKDTVSRLTPSINTNDIDGRTTGIALEQQLDLAEGMLRAMSLTNNFARVVMLVGHGATTVNNPYTSGLDCGACGGHSGEANARVAAQTLNNPAVRAGLAKRGINIPEDTIFVGGKHDTTTDEVTIFDQTGIPATHKNDIADIQEQLNLAGKLSRTERSTLLNVDNAQDIDKAVIRRSKDWSQVRPEWGLAGCAAFIVAPREQTQGIDLDGRSFLHTYKWQQDDNFSVLESIMTAPMVVGSWINLQYYASSVDNAVFGSGNKTLHNVVGTVGILEGNGGDLRVGLPWQSVHDGENYVHEPLRLNVMINAPIEAMNDIISKHGSVRELVDNGWIYLFALNDNGEVTHQYQQNLEWDAISSETVAL